MHTWSFCSVLWLIHSPSVKSIQLRNTQSAPGLNKDMHALVVNTQIDGPLIGRLTDWLIDWLIVTGSSWTTRSSRSYRSGRSPRCSRTSRTNCRYLFPLWTQAKNMIFFSQHMFMCESEKHFKCRIEVQVFFKVTVTFAVNISETVQDRDVVTIHYGPLIWSHLWWLIEERHFI